MTAGLCECGCGLVPLPAPYTSRTRGWVKGQPVRFIRWHQGVGRKRTMPKGELSKAWKGGRRIHCGYAWIRVGTTGRQGIYKPEHVLVAERVLGRTLPEGAIVHHVDGSRANNVPSNLVVLSSRQDHIELHRKLRVLRALGNPWTDRMCSTCKTPRPTERFYKGSGHNRYGSRCIDCTLEYHRNRNRKAVAA